MKQWLAVAAAAAITAALSQASFADGPIESRYTRLTHCRVIDVSDDMSEGDFVAHRCTGIGSLPVWLTYHEGTKMALGFGPRANESGIYSTQRDDTWPIEWRGRAGPRFKPFAAIVRVRFQELPGTALVVYRLRGDGTSCVIGDANGAGDNDRAAAMADASLANFKCLQEPYISGVSANAPGKRQGARP